MRRLAVVLSAIALVAIALSGCEDLSVLVARTNLWVESVEPVFVDDEFAGAEIRVRNDGASARHVSFAVVLTEDDVADHSDPFVYEGTFDIDARGTRTLLVGREPHMEPFLSRMNRGVGPGEFLVGVIVDDREEIREENEDDNSAVAIGTRTVTGLMETNLSVGRVDMRFHGEIFDGLDIGFRNDGAGVRDVSYSVSLSTDGIVDGSDILVFEGLVSLGFAESRSVFVSRQNQIEPFLAGAGEIPPDFYHVAVVIDTGNIVGESDEEDNHLVTVDTLEVNVEMLPPDGFEFNDSFDQFATFPQGYEMWQWATLHDSGDHDWYEVWQMMDMPLFVDIRPGPNGMDVPVYVEVYRYDDPGMTSPVYVAGPFLDHYVYIEMFEAEGMEQWWRVHVWSPAGETGEYEIQAYY